MKRLLIAAIALSALALSACSPGAESVAREACTNDAKEQRPDITSWDFSGLETIDASETMFDAGISSSLDDNTRVWSTTGTVTHKSANKTHQKTMFCLVTVEDGKLAEPADAILN